MESWRLQICFGPIATFIANKSCFCMWLRLYYVIWWLFAAIRHPMHEFFKKTIRRGVCRSVWFFLRVGHSFGYSFDIVQLCISCGDNNSWRCSSSYVLLLITITVTYDRICYCVTRNMYIWLYGTLLMWHSVCKGEAACWNLAHICIIVFYWYMSL